jgi:hypothetical protein
VRLAADELAAALKRRQLPPTHERGVRRLAIVVKPNGSASAELELDPYPSRRNDAGKVEALRTQVSGDSVAAAMRERARSVDQLPRTGLPSESK